MDYSYLGSGKIYIREKGAAAALIEVGNCSALNLSVTEDTKELKDYTQPGGGTYNEVRRISAVEMSLTAHDISPANLARALYGSTAEVASGTASAEELVAYKGGVVKTAKVPLAITSVKSGTGESEVTYTAGTDYVLVSGGIYIPAGSTVPAVVAGAANVKATYTYDKHDYVEALTSSGKEYEMLFVGLNEARSGKVVRVEVHRAKIGAAQQISLIGEDYAALEVTGKLLKDTTITSAGVSQYFKSLIVQ